ncbi:unnamed protein product [Trifolium pratense]|uniref:Uncharacterized protein n=1 Tax=Trifolium pratense TaxID=57577 RepID=A0ACB0LAG8_TRIPR|nr:unnamed protein product [Trifolium pratense]
MTHLKLFFISWGLDCCIYLRDCSQFLIIFFRCMEDLVSTTHNVSWSIHNKSRAGLHQFLDSFGGTEHSNVCNDPTAIVLSQTNLHEKEDTKPRQDVEACSIVSY